MKAEEGLEKLGEMAPYIASITEKLSKDEEVMKIMRTVTKDNTALVFMQLLPKLSKMKELFNLVAIYFGKSEEEVKEEPLAEFLNEVKTMMLDSDIQSFTSSLSKKAK